MPSTENNYVATDLGNIALNPCGEYSKSTLYEYLDMVSYQGGSYFCKVDFPQKISGIAPEPGKNTEMWQMLTLPGDMTPEYIAIRDEVVEKAEQVESSRAAVELSRQEIEDAQADVQQMRLDAQEAAEQAIASRDGAAGYAQSAEASRTAAAESEQNINAQVTGFDTHVAEKTSAAESAIIEARQTAVNTVSAKQGDAVQAVTGEGNKQIKNVEDAGTEQVGKVKSAGASAVSTAGAAGVSAVNAVKTQQTASIKVVADKGTQQVTAVNTAGSTQASIIETKGADQVKAIQEAGENALQNISNGVDKGLSEEGKAADAKATGEAISKLTEDLGNKITKFYASNEGKNHLADSDNGKIIDMMLYGKSEQFTTTGKNLLKIRDGTQTIRGVTVTAKDGVVALKGTATETGWAILNIDSFVLDGTHTLSSNISGDTRIIASNKSYKTILEQGKSVVLENTEVSKVCFAVTDGKTYDISNILIQIEKGSVATSYEPYTGGIPSPNPSYPQEIKSVVNPIVKLSNEDGTQFETVTLPYTLNAIPVSSDGNVTIDGQQYIADYVDVERGKLVKRVYEYVFSGEGRWNAAADGAQYLAWRVGDNPGIIDSTYDKKCLCSCLIANIMNTTRKGENYISTQSFDDTYRIWVSANVATSKLTGEKVFLALIVPEEISLTQEEIRAFKELAAYYPVTNVNVASEQLNGYTVFNYPVSMKNGWNYVKQQLNDNRDYIYDMDLQSAEAYVNSAYAVALTELEV
ncbi:hypothetical protein JYQ79_12930 [Anaerobutyricum hallii]|uniref:hypothetical protein n=1 Tax=Anaerobutyricum hallii TaxID=39488 RepID=UPI001ADDA9D1|nr:hypothetical protein [Anaerobutyricum hallii]MBP0067649.1 hypothetical protein [Anaerobutyricum hallii]